MKRVLEKRVVPVAVISKAEDAVPIAEALLAGGLDIIEITLRTPSALDAVKAITKTLPQMLVGAGTILTPDQVQQAIDAGARFGVSPGINAKVVQKAVAQKLPFMPGVMTPSEVELGLEFGCKLLKFFPAEPAGGLKMLKALAGPYGHTGVKFLPLGGLKPASAAEYLASPIVGAIGGSWLVEKATVAARNWTEITRLTAEIMEIARRTPAAG